MLELTEQQARALAQEQTPLELVNPLTREVFVVIRRDVYELACSIVGGAPGQVWDDADDDLIRKKA